MPNPGMIFLRAMLAAVVMLLAACAGAPDQSRLTPQEGKGQLVIYRMSPSAGRFGGMAASVTNPFASIKAPRMSLNGAPLAKSGGKRGVRCRNNLSFVVNLPAGEHTLTLGEAEDAPSTRIVITAGQTAYVKCIARSGAPVMPERVFSPYTVKREIAKTGLGGVYEIN